MFTFMFVCRLQESASGSEFAFLLSSPPPPSLSSPSASWLLLPFPPYFLVNSMVWESM